MRSRAGCSSCAPESPVERVLVEDGEATGVEYVDGAGERHTVRAQVRSSSPPAR